MISVVPSAYVNPFYLTVPPGMLYPSLVIAILACVVASQAVITGSFQVSLPCAPFFLLLRIEYVISNSYDSCFLKS